MQVGGPSDEVGQKERGFPCPLAWLGPKEKGETVYSSTTKPALGTAVEILDRFGLGDLDWSRFLGRNNKLLQATSRSRSHGAL